MKSYLKVIPRFILQSKNLICHHVCRYPVPKTKINISKIKIYTGVNNYRTEIKQHGASRLISFSFSLQKDTRTRNQAQTLKHNEKNHQNMSNIYSISVNPVTFSFSHLMGPRINFSWTVGSPTV